MSRWTASAQWAAGPALDGQRDMPLALHLSEGLGISVGSMRSRLNLYGKLSAFALVVQQEQSCSAQPAADARGVVGYFVH